MTMKIKGIQYKVFGKLEDIELIFGNTLNVVLGRNEAGKSTIFESIKTLIYGFRPTSRDKHPYTHWEKNEIQFTGEIEEGMELFAIERSLKSVPKFNLHHKASGSVQTFRNEALPSVKTVSEMLYESVFHLTAEALGTFEKESWETIQEKLIFNYGTDYLVKTSEVISKLEQDINALWRRDKRGNPLINQIQAEINGLKLKRHEVAQEYDIAKSKMDRLEQIERNLEMLTKEKDAVEKKIALYREALPIKALKEKIELIQRAIYNEEAFDNLSPKIIDGINDYNRRLSEIDGRKQYAIKQIDELDQTMTTFTAQDLKLLSLLDDHEHLIELHDQLMKLEHEAHLKLDDLMKTKEKSANQFKFLFGVDLSDELKISLKKIQVLDVMSGLQKYAENAQKNIEIEKRLKLMRESNGKLTLLIAFLGVLTVILGFMVSDLSLVRFLGFAMLGYSLARFRPAAKDFDQSLFDLTSLTESIKAAMHQIELPEYVWGDESQRFLGKLEALIMTLLEEEAIEARWIEILEREKTLESEIKDHFKAFDIDTSRGSKLTLQYTLAQMEVLSKIEADENKKKMKRETMLEALNRIEDERENIISSLETLIEEVTRFGDGDFSFGQEQIIQNHEHKLKIKLYEDELRRFNQDDSISVDVSKEKIEALEVERSGLYALERDLIEEKHIVANALSKARDKMNLEDIDSEILLKEELLTDLVNKRDRLMILYEIVKYSDEKFRRLNQPNMMSRVSYFMSRMTGGKYSEVLIDEQMSLQFLVDGEILPISKAFSKGTIQQLFFAYRLAIIESLDPAGSLPLVLDETFVNWDLHRFRETVDLICEVAKERQIFVFTCHQYVADHFLGHSEATLLEVAV